MRCNAGHSALRSNICRVGKGARAKVYTIRASLTARAVPTRFGTAAVRVGTARKSAPLPTLRRGREKTATGN
jgi:hypothetical protein